MVRHYSEKVMPHHGRWKADVPGAFAILAGIAFATGVTSSDIRTNETLGPIVWGSGAAAVLLGVLWATMRARLQWQLDVGDHGVRIIGGGRGARTIDLGVPRSVRHGAFKLMLTAGHARRRTPHLWVAVEGADGRVVLFQRAMGVMDRVPDWPAGTPPASKDVFGGVPLDIVLLREVLEARAK
jgi:hypothetical protein